MEIIGLVIDAIVLVLLAATIYFAVRLSRQLAIVREGQDDLQKLTEELSGAVSRADHAIGELHDAAEDAGGQLDGATKDARKLYDELQIMIEVGNSLAERLQVLAERSRKASGAGEIAESPAVKERPTGKSAKKGRAPSRAEQELEAALRDRRQEPSS